MKRSRKKVSWEVFWKADDGNHSLGITLAASSYEARVNLAQSMIMFENSFAVLVSDRAD